MELTQQEIKWIKDRYAQEQAMFALSQRDKLVQKARKEVEERYKPQLDLLAQEERFEERKALVEIMVAEADDAEQIVLQQHS